MTFEPILQFGYTLRFRILKACETESSLCPEAPSLTVWAWRAVKPAKEKCHLLTTLINRDGISRAALLIYPGLLNIIALIMFVNSLSYGLLCVHTENKYLSNNLEKHFLNIYIYV